jgi:hypothetical protein
MSHVLQIHSKTVQEIDLFYVFYAQFVLSKKWNSKKTGTFNYFAMKNCVGIALKEKSMQGWILLVLYSNSTQTYCLQIR